MGMDERELAQARRREIRSQRRASLKTSEDELKRFEEGWTNMMITIWQEKLQLLGVHDTDALRNSLEAKALLEGAKKSIQHSFLAYGKYVDDGTGREFTNTGYTDSLGRYYASSREADGTLPFLLPGGEQYREEHGLNKPKKVGPAWGGRVAGGHPRKAQEWFSRKYFASRMVLNEMEREFYGSTYLGMLTTGIDNVMDRVRVM